MLTRNFDLKKIECPSDELIVFVDENSCVNFVAWHKDGDGTNYYQHQVVEFFDFDVAKAYVSDMTIVTAQAVINNYCW